MPIWALLAYLGGSGPGFGPILVDEAWIWAYFGDPGLDLDLFGGSGPGFWPISVGEAWFGPILGDSGLDLGLFRWVWAWIWAYFGG